jgi:hypothetical protein
METCIKTFYNEVTSNDVWYIYSQLVPPSASRPWNQTIVDHRFFYYKLNHPFSAIGEIAIRIVFRVRKMKVPNEQILACWKNRLDYYSKPSSRGFFIEEIMKAVICKHGIRGIYEKVGENPSISTQDFDSGMEFMRCFLRILKLM